MSNEAGSEDEFACPVCGETFDTEEDRDEHLVHKHPD